MADPTPPSDIPDPASPTPAAPAPGPKRIRSVPDRPASARPSGSIRSVPESARGDARMSNTYAASALGNERSWGRGLAILWALFLATLLMEMLNAACYLLAGKVGWPLPIDVARIALVCTFFIALWSGLGWLRYLLAAIDFLAGAWLLTDCILSYRAYPKFAAIGQADWTIYSSGESFPKIAVALLCLVTAAYLLLSYDVREFLAHRRARGRIWSALLVTVVAYGGMLLIFAAPLFYGEWMQAQRADAQSFGDATLRAAAENWDATALDDKLDAAYAKTFTKADRATTFGNFKALGPLKNIDPAPVVARPAMPQYPLQDKVPIPQGIDSQPDATRRGFTLTAKYAPTSVDFEHGHGKFGFDLTRDLFGPWRITKLNVESVQYDHPPKPATPPSPDASPAPADPNAVPAPPAASPGPTTSTMATDAAAPSPAVTPASSPTTAAPVPPTPPPSASVARPPAASPANPAATPVPSTGG